MEGAAHAEDEGMELSRRKRRLTDRLGKEKQEDEEEEAAAAAAAETKDWPSLTEPLLHSILNRLDTVKGILAFRGVCRSWRSISNPAFPLILLTLSPDSLALYDITSQRLYQPQLPWRLQSRYSIGCSHGYLIISTPAPYQRPVLWSLFTRAHIRLPRPPSPFRRVILSSTPSSSECWVVLFQSGSAVIQYGRLGDRRWKCHNWSMIKDLIFFDGKLYSLSYNGFLGTIEFVPRPRVTALEVKHQEPPHWNSSSRDWRLAESGGELLLVHFVFEDGDMIGTPRGDYLARIDVYRWDFLWGERKKVTDLGGRAMFMGNDGFAASVVPNGLGVRGNCIYYIRAAKNEWFVFSMEDETIDVVSPSWPGLAVGETWEPPIWVFPSLC